MIISILTITVTLSACGGSGKQKEPSKESQNLINMIMFIMKLLNDGDSETPNVEIKYKDKKVNHIYRKADLDHVYEHILGDGNKTIYCKGWEENSCISTTIYDLWR